jgi:hypothetical protein
MKTPDCWFIVSEAYAHKHAEAGTIMTDVQTENKTTGGQHKPINTGKTVNAYRMPEAGQMVSSIFFKL